MKFFILLLILAGAGYFLFQNPPDIVTNQLEQIVSTKISKNLAVENVKKLPEVQEYLKNVPNGKVEVDNELEGEYNVHVYEVKNGHTATFNWYRVSIKSGEVRSEFQAEPSNDQEQTSMTKDKESGGKTGLVTGKLCYPSEFLPQGKLEYKNIANGKVDYENYPGSENGGSNTYSFQLEVGDYYLRYVTSRGSIGYSTTVCPTGQEESCGDKNTRVLRKASIKEGKTISGYDLCDYYYSSSNSPKF